MSEHSNSEQPAGTHELRSALLTRRAVLGLGLGVGLTLGSLAACSSKKSDGTDGTGSGSDSGSRADGSGDGSDVSSGSSSSLANAEELLDSLSTEQKVAQLFVIRPEDIVDVQIVTSAGDATKAAIQKYPVGGICYFGQNLLDTNQTTEMLSNVKSYSREACGINMLCAVDEEGGTVSRIGGNSGFNIQNVGNMSDVGATGDTDYARQVATTIGGYLTDLGFNMDFAPDADITNNPESTTMAKRSFGSTASVVAPMVQAQVEGFLSTGVGCCAKHFPGIGAANGDSETEPIVSEKTADQMASEELVPFQYAIAAGVPMVMVGHLSCPNITGTNVPASLSKQIVTDLLRNKLGFTGVIITDSLGMGAITSSYDSGQAVLAALDAGVDMVLMPADFQAAYQAVLEAVNSGSITQDRLDDSVKKIIQMKLALDAATGDQVADTVSNG